MSIQAEPNLGHLGNIVSTQNAEKALVGIECFSILRNDGSSDNANSVLLDITAWSSVSSY